MKRVIIELEHRGIVPVEDAVGTQIDCLRGRIWITEMGSTDDIVLEAGQRYVISRGGVALVQALREALVGLRAPAVRQAGGGLATWVEQNLEPLGYARGRQASGITRPRGGLTRRLFRHVGTKHP